MQRQHCQNEKLVFFSKLGLRRKNTLCYLNVELHIAAQKHAKNFYTMLKEEHLMLQHN